MRTILRHDGWSSDLENLESFIGAVKLIFKSIFNKRRAPRRRISSAVVLLHTAGFAYGDDDDGDVAIVHVSRDEMSGA